MKPIDKINEIMEIQLNRIHERTKDRDLTKDDAQVLYTLSQIIQLHSKFKPSENTEEEQELGLSAEELTQILKKK